MSEGPKILLIPGLFDSGPDHWQSRWQRKYPEFLRVYQKDWETPICSDWLAEIDRVVEQSGSNVILVGHSLGCATIAHWAARSRKAVGALLVAPSDVEAPTYPAGTSGFSPVPIEKLPFASLVVASSNDPYVTVDRAQAFAKGWGSEFELINDAGHINTASGFGPWPQGLQLLERLGWVAP